MKALKTRKLKKRRAQITAEDLLRTLPVDFPNVTVQVVSRALGITDKDVHRLVDAGELMAWCLNDTWGAPVRRRHIRILRFSVQGYFYEKLASAGKTLPVTEHWCVTWWRNYLRAQRGLSPVPTTPL